MKTRQGKEKFFQNNGRVVCSGGYVHIYMPEHPRANLNGKYVREHILIAEKALGKPLPPKAQVHHFSKNRQHNTNSNLVICQDQAYHSLLHFRQRIVALDGDPNIEKPCCTCKAMLPKSAFSVRRAHKVDGLSLQCRKCSKIDQAEIRSRK